jgi:hypothetical protein
VLLPADEGKTIFGGGAEFRKYIANGIRRNKSSVIRYASQQRNRAGSFSFDDQRSRISIGRDIARNYLMIEGY